MGLRGLIEWAMEQEILVAVIVHTWFVGFWVITLRLDHIIDLLKG